MLDVALDAVVLFPYLEFDLVPMPIQVLIPTILTFTLLILSVLLLVRGRDREPR